MKFRVKDSSELSISEETREIYPFTWRRRGLYGFSRNILLRVVREFSNSGELERWVYERLVDKMTNDLIALVKHEMPSLTEECRALYREVVLKNISLSNISSFISSKSRLYTIDTEFFRVRLFGVNAERVLWFESVSLPSKSTPVIEDYWVKLSDLIGVKTTRNTLVFLITKSQLIKCIDKVGNSECDISINKPMILEVKLVKRR